MAALPNKTMAELTVICKNNQFGGYSGKNKSSLVSHIMGCLFIEVKLY